MPDNATARPADIAAYDHKPASYFGHARTEIAPLLPAAAARVLEIGCGSGGTLRWLRTVRHVEYAAGIELMPAAAEAARAVFDRVSTASLEDPAALAGETGFDLILALDVLEHLSDPIAVVGRLRDLLAPGGCVIASVPNVANLVVSWDLFWRGRWRYQDEGILDRTHLRFFDEHTAREMFALNGLNVERIAYTERYTFLDRVALLRRNAWARWQARKLMARLLPRHLVIGQFLLRAGMAP